MVGDIRTDIDVICTLTHFKTPAVSTGQRDTGMLFYSII